MPWHKSHLLDIPNRKSNHGLIVGPHKNGNLSYMQMIIGEQKMALLEDFNKSNIPQQSLIGQDISGPLIMAKLFESKQGIDMQINSRINPSKMDHSNCNNMYPVHSGLNIMPQIQEEEKQSIANNNNEEEHCSPLVNLAQKQYQTEKNN